MADEKDAFYVVRKGDIVGVYKNYSDFQPLLYGPNVAVFKGYGLPKAAEDFLASHGLNNAIYSIGVSDVQSQLFGQLVTCPFQQPPTSNDKAVTSSPAETRIKKKVGSTSVSDSPQKKPPEIESFMDTLPVSAYCVSPQKKPPEIESFMDTLPVSAYCCSCVLEFDGAAKGNPGPAGAGAVLRAIDGSLVYRLREGLGVATNNVAEYRAVILGLRYALERGFRHIRVQGDSKLVCMQVNGVWKTKTENMTSLCKAAKELKDRFASFQICHIEREFNTEADAQANMGVHLQNGEVQEEVERR